MKCPFGLLSLVLLSGTVVCQTTLLHGDAERVGLSTDKLRAAAQLVEDAVRKDELRGAVVLVARRKKIVLHEAYGWRDAKKKKRMRKDSLFRMASNSKAVTAAAVLILVDDGKLELDDKVHEHLPSFDNEKGDEITIRHLLTHTSGLRIRPLFLRPLLEKSDEHPDAPSLRSEVSRFGAIGAAVAPGTTWKYSNAGYNTLAALVEVGSKKPYKTFLRERIYAPLGMMASCNHESDADNTRMSAIFRRGSKGWRIGWQPGDEPDFPFPRGSGGMISTAADFAVFCQMFLNGGEYGGKRVLDRSTASAAVRPQSKHIAAAKNYGFGWRIGADGVFSHGGSDGTWAFVDPKREIIGLVFTQSPGGKNPRQRFRELVTAACSN